MRNVKRASTREERDLVRDFFSRIDDDYFPPLSERKCGVDSYLTGNIIYVEKDGNIRGALGYTSRPDEIEVDIVGVSKDGRGSFDFIRLLETAVLNEVDSDKKVRAKTWSTNEKMKSILGKIGFEKVATVHGDVHPQRISEVYETNLDRIREFLMLNEKKKNPAFELNWFSKSVAACWLAGASYVLFEGLRNPESLEYLNKAVTLLG